MSLDPALLARLGTLQVRARAVVEGVLAGLHRSPHHGQSVEFAEHKEYAPGDEIKHIDWRAYAKSDRYTVKRFEMESNLRAVLVVDGSGSMGFGRGVMTKLDYAKICAGALAVLLARQGDQVALMIAGAPDPRGEKLPAGVRSFLPFGSSNAHVQELLRQLDETKSEGATLLAPALDFAAEKAGRRALFIVLSDFLDAAGDEKASLAALARIRSRRHDVLALQTMDREELEFPFDDPTRFLSMEADDGPVTGIDAQPRQIRDSYLEELARFLAKVKSELGRADVEQQLFPTDAPPDRALLTLLRRRERSS